MLDRSRLTTKSQTTIPRTVRERLDLKPGDSIVYDVVDGRIVLSKLSSEDAMFLKSMESQFEEWLSPEDCAAFDDL